MSSVGRTRRDRITCTDNLVSRLFHHRQGARAIGKLRFLVVRQCGNFHYSVGMGVCGENIRDLPCYGRPGCSYSGTRFPQTPIGDQPQGPSGRVMGRGPALHPGESLPVIGTGHLGEQSQRSPAALPSNSELGSRFFLLVKLIVTAVWRLHLQIHGCGIHPRRRELQLPLALPVSV